MITNKRIAAFGLVGLACLLMALFSARCYSDGNERGRSYATAQHASSSLHIGMLRQETEQYVQEAWRHYSCEYSDFSIDIYVFGSRELSLAGTLYLRFDKKGEQQTPTQIASIDYYMLHQFDYCTISEK